MGRPYALELRNFHQTYDWALKVPCEKLSSIFGGIQDLPLVAVGSGGSLTAAHIVALLHQRTGALAKAITPLELISCESCMREVNLLFLSAEGKNQDIISAFHFAALSEPSRLIALCMRAQSPLETLSKKFRYTQFLGLDIPSGKDGFLATNSLLGFVTILIRTYRELLCEKFSLPAKSALMNGVCPSFG